MIFGVGSFVFDCDCSCRRALEAKAALYERLSKGEGLKQLGEDEEAELGEGQHRYMVDFTKKIVEVMIIAMMTLYPIAMMTLYPIAMMSLHLILMMSLLVY